MSMLPMIQGFSPRSKLKNLVWDFVTNAYLVYPFQDQMVLVFS